VRIDVNLKADSHSGNLRKQGHRRRPGHRCERRSGCRRIAASRWRNIHPKVDDVFTVFERRSGSPRCLKETAEMILDRRSDTAWCEESRRGAPFDREVICG
jgi:hypothetical protein